MSKTVQMVKTVNATAKRIGGGARKVFICDVAAALELDVAAFRAWLTKVGCEVGVRLCRCDLVEAFPAEKVAASATPAFVGSTDPCTVWHFIIVE